ncbi:hypothetical protein PHMEG_0006762 [Phytophthora megakarya]|uniref:GRIP domain-containing protein n=1 Tax=Phytophthora megakarya TaxID=4795 RepID=A0A225WQ97_9STRA|nr:hypothetical protein PHMEG_0006762 [Phytophthora megakarya]
MLKKKEKLEQMRELGRGGLSKGLHFLRSATTNASLENGESSTSTDASEPPGAATNRMTYEELLALSMKLTRQNKLMKAQYQKNQNKLAAADASDAHVLALRGFLETDVGLDVAACVEDNSTPGGTINMEILKEKYRILSELKYKKLQQETKPAVESVNLLDLSPIATDQKPRGYNPVGLLGNTCNKLDDSQVDEAMEQVERMREQLRQGAEYTKELERKLTQRDEQQETERGRWEQEKLEWQTKWEQLQIFNGNKVSDEQEEMQRLVELKGELEKKIREMSEELDAGVKQRQDEHRRAEETLAKVEQEKMVLGERLQRAETAALTAAEVEASLKSQQVELDAAKADSARLQEQLEALQATPAAPVGTTENEVKEKMATVLEEQQDELDAAKAEIVRLQEQVQTLEVPTDVSEDEKNEKMEAALEAKQAELECAKAENACLQEQIQTLQAAPTVPVGAIEDKVEDKVAAALKIQQTELDAAKAKNARLQEQVQTLQETTSSVGISEDEVMKKVEAALEAQQSELRAAKAENTRLQGQFQTLLEAGSSLGSSEDESKENVAAALEAQQLELEVAKTENAQLQELIESLQHAAASVASETQMNETEEVVNSLRDEVDRLDSLLKSKECASEALQQELESLKEQVQNAQEEASQKGALMQELERVKLQSAGYAHKVQSLHIKFCAAEERLTKESSEKEATLSLVEALKEDTSRLADQVAQFEQGHIISEMEITALTEAKRELEEQQKHAQETKATLEKQLEEERVYWTSKLENLITDSDTANSKTETLEAELREREKQVSKMSASQTSMTSQLMELQKQVSSMREDLTMAAEGLEAHATKAEENERRCIHSEKEATGLKKQLDEMRDKYHENFEMLRQEKEAELERIHTERRTLVDERKELTREKDELSTRCKTLERELQAVHKHEEELETSMKEQTLQVGNLGVDLAETKKSLSDRMALATRLQTENMGMAGKLAEQVALIEGALRDAANSKTTLQEIEAQLHTAKADVQCMKKSETQAKQDLENVQRGMLKQKENFQQEREEAKRAVQTAVENEKQNSKRELERLEVESKHKSKLALQAVLEKEKEIARLSARLNEVEEDVRSGGADNRKILEFAQLQAKREAEQREQAAQMQELSLQLEEAQHEIQELREDKRRHTEELTAMLQNQRRDGVNMEYLKNVVVQYMSFRPGSSQQARLVPVLTTLLQFTAADIKEIKHAARRGNSWTSWASSDASLDYKPIVIGAGHRHPIAPPSAQDNGGQRSPLNRISSAPVPRVTSPSGSPLESSRASSFFLPSGGNDEPTDQSAESADF